MEEGQLCLALPPLAAPPIWEHGRIQHVDVEAGTCVIEWCSQAASSSSDGMPRSSSFSNLEAGVTSLALSHVHPIKCDSAQMKPYSSVYSFEDVSEWSDEDDGEDTEDDLYKQVQLCETYLSSFFRLAEEFINNLDLN